MKKIQERLLQFFCPDFDKWEKVLITQTGTTYFLIIQRRKSITGLYQFKSILIGQIDEMPSIETLDKLIK